MLAMTRVAQAMTVSGFRYWSVLVLANNGSTAYINCSEVELRASIGGPDLTTPATPVAVSSGAVYPSSNIVDNNIGTFFITGVNQVVNQRFTFDMGAAVSVKELGWQIRQNSSADQAPKNFNVQASNDNSSWVTVASFTDATGWGNPMRFFSW